MNPFFNLTVSQLPADAEPALANARAAFGFVPNLAVAIAVSPPSLNGYLANFQTLSQGSLSPLEQQLVLLSASVAQKVGYSVAVHSVLAAQAGLAPSDVEAIRHGRPVADERLEALRLFTRAAVEGRGRVPDDVLSRFTAADWTRRQIVEVFYAMATKEFVYLLQRLADVPLDAPLQGAAWNG